MLSAKKDREAKNHLSDVQPEDLVRFGIIPELIGRLPVITTLTELDEDALVEILTKPKNAIVRQYQALLEMEGVKLTIKEDALRAIAKKPWHVKVARVGLRSILEKLLLQPMFDAPDRPELAEIVMDADVVENKKITNGSSEKNKESSIKKQHK